MEPNFIFSYCKASKNYFHASLRWVVFWFRVFVIERKCGVILLSDTICLSVSLQDCTFLLYFLPVDVKIRKKRGGAKQEKQVRPGEKEMKKKNLEHENGFIQREQKIRKTLSVPSQKQWEKCYCFFFFFF